GGSSCSSDLTDSSAPVELVVTNTQNVSRIDLAGDVTGSTACQGDIGTINMQVIPKSAAATGDFVNVRVTSYRVSYQRTDGGKLVPAPFTRSIDTLIASGDSGSIPDLIVFQPGAATQAPFVSLLPSNGGRDPDTGLPIVKMDVIVEVFGRTLGGDNVYDATRF